MDSNNSLRRTMFICVLLSALTLAAYWPVFHNDFISYDDPDYVTTNLHVAGGLSWENVIWAFCTAHSGNWHPLTWLSHMLDAQFFGLNPGWHHLTNILLHGANAVLLFLLLQYLTGAPWRSAFVAALFALHPLHVESVAWVAERKDVLSTFFFMLTLRAYASYAEGRSKNAEGPSNEPTARLALHASRFYVLSLILFALGLMSKPMLVTLPFILLLFDIWPLERLRLSAVNCQLSDSISPLFTLHPLSSLRPLVLEKLPFFALAATSCVVTYFVQAGAGAAVSLNAIPLRWRLFNALFSYVIYLRKMIWPTDLAVTYPLPGPHLASGAWPAGQLLAAALFLLAVSAVAMWRWKRQPWLATGWFWYLGTLVPVIGLVQVGGQARADRYTYIPLIGIFICLVWGTAELCSACRRRYQQAHRQDSEIGGQDSAPLDTSACRGGKALWGRLLPGAAGLLVVGACIVATRNQLSYWRDDVALFEHALAIAPYDNAAAHYALGRAFTRQSKYALAISHYQAVAETDPLYPGLYSNLAGALMLMGKPNQAAEQYRTALRLKPGDASARDSLARVLLALGKYDEALAEYAELARIAPASPVPAFGKGTLLLAEGRAAEAEGNFEEALRRKPDHAEALTGLATALVMQNRFAEAEGRFREVLRLSPTNARVHILFGKMLLSLGRDTEASTCFATALQLAPDLPAKSIQSAKADISHGQFQAAVSRLATVLQLLPDDAEALNELAWIRASAPESRIRNGAEAVHLAERACRLSGGKEARFYGALDAAYAEAGRFDEAIQTAQKVREMAQAAGQEEIAQGAEQRMALYRQHQPYRLEPQVKNH